MRSRTILPLLCILTLLGATFYLWNAVSAGTPLLMPLSVSNATKGGGREPASPALMEWDEARRILMDPARDPNSPGLEEDELRRITGRVVMLDGSQTPKDLDVKLLFPPPHEEGIPDYYRQAEYPPSIGRTDSDGSFRVEIPQHILPGTLIQVAVVEGGEKVFFQGAVRVDDGMIILVQPPKYLHGTIVGANQLCESAGFGLAQELSLGRTNRLAIGRLDEDENFYVFTRVVKKGVPVILRVGCGGSIYAFETDLETLTSTKGYRVELTTRQLTVQAQDELGKPLANVILGVGTATLSNSNNGTMLRVQTDAKGQAEVFLKVNVDAVMYGALAGRAQVRRVIPGGREPIRETITLRKLEIDDLIEGQVLDRSGLPVEGAIVTARPVAEVKGLNLLLPAQVRTNAEGRFKLGVGGDGLEFSVRAFKKSHGMSRKVFVEVPAQDMTLEVPGVRWSLSTASRLYGPTLP